MKRCDYPWTGGDDMYIWEMRECKNCQQSFRPTSADRATMRKYNWVNPNGPVICKPCREKIMLGSQSYAKAIRENHGITDARKKQFARAGFLVSIAETFYHILKRDPVKTYGALTDMIALLRDC